MTPVICLGWSVDIAAAAVCLTVCARIGNSPAIQLYQKLGDKVVGCLHQAQYRDREYYDDLKMSLLF
jgi:RimJ/RimL family protein N-acetyltransferase